MLVAALLMLGAGDAAATHTCVPGVPPDNDGDRLPVTCDPFGWNPDLDGDGFEDSLEIFVGTDPSSLCSFPPDIDNDGDVDVGDIIKAFLGRIPSTIDDPEYRARHDLNADENLNVGDVIVLGESILTFCPFPTHSSTRTVQLHPETGDSDLAFHWYTDHAEIYSEEEGVYKTAYCDEFERAGDHWSNTTDFDFSVSYDREGECDVPGNVAFYVVYWPPPIAASVSMWTLDRQCSTSNPCFYAYFARLYMNANHLDNNSISYRHMVFTHEFGHVVAQDDISGCPSPVWSIMFDTTDCLWNAGLHWPRGNDILFTNIKY